MRERTNSKNFEDLVRGKRMRKTRDPTKLEDKTDFITDQTAEQVQYIEMGDDYLSEDEYVDEDEVVYFTVT